MNIKTIIGNPTQVEDIVRTAYQKAQEVQPILNASVSFVEPSEQLANLKGKETGLMYGVPVVLKDNVNTKGIKTTASSKMLENYVPIYDATIVKKLREAGAVVVAKASMDELAMGGTNLTAVSGPVKNPYDLTCMPGGSSGGSAALVAAGVVPMAIGTDTGDSIRKPASFCGIVGLKPTYGRISRYGIIPYSSSLDHVGCFTRNVHDAAVALEVLAGRDDHDMTSSSLPVEHYVDALTHNIQGKKIAVLKNVTDNLNQSDTQAVFEELVHQLKEKGAQVIEVEMNEALLKAILPAYYLIANCEATANHSNLDGIRFGLQLDEASSQEMMIQSRTQGFGPLIRKRFVIGSYGLFVENQEKLFRQAQRVRRLIVEEMNRILADCDAIMAPASRSGAPKLDDVSRDQLEDGYLIAENHMVLGNFSGYPSCTVPMGMVGGMPVGVNLTSKAFDEGNLLNICAVIEDCTGLKDCVKEVSK